jgi:predicted transcriptional regulator
MDVERSRLADLVTEINQEHRLVYQASLDALDHAIQCGLRLIEAREQVTDGKWGKWVENNLNITPSAVTRYMRIATYRDQLAAAENRPQTINAAMTYLNEIDAPPRYHGRTGKRPTFDVEEAKRLREMGMTLRQIGDALGVSDVAVSVQLNPPGPEWKEKRERAARDRRALQRAQTETKVADRIREIGGPLAHAYAMLGECIDALSRALIEADNDELFGALSIALANTQRAEGVIARVFK